MKRFYNRNRRKNRIRAHTQSRNDNATIVGNKLNGLLHGSDEPSERFGNFVAALDDMGATKWTTATYFSFLCHTDSQMFVKPTITQNAAALCRWEINYQPKVNWQTYSLILKLAGHLFEELAELEPRDFIDIQSFMWCIAQQSR